MNCMHEQAHFSLQVLAVQSAYIRAAGSEFARNPTRKGGLASFERVSWTSLRIVLAIVPARTTLQDAGVSSAFVAILSKIGKIMC